MPPARPRVFGIGLGRTATTSLNRALQVLGYRAIHYPHPARTLNRNFDEIELHDAATDSPVAECFPDLDAAFPGSRFILTTRDVDSWIDSIRGWMSRRKPVDQQHHSHREMRRRLLGSDVFDETTFRRGFHHHHQRVEAYFASRPQDLLVLRIIDGDGWQPLCQFLGKPIPAEPFPLRNISPRRIAENDFVQQFWAGPQLP